MLNEKIKTIREKAGLTQEEFAKELFVSRTAVTKWETGKSLPNIDTLRMISEKYDVSIDELLHNEAESGFYKAERRASFGNMDLTKKQKIIACVVFFAIVAIIFVSISVSSINKSRTVYSEAEMADYNEVVKIAPAILEEWTEEKGYWFRTIDFSPIIGVTTSMNSFTYEIFEKEEDKEGDNYLYRLEFSIKDAGLTPSVWVQGDDLKDCQDELFNRLHEINELIEKFGGEKADIDFIAKKFHEGTDGDINSIKEPFDQAGNFFISGSTFDAMISDHSYMPEGFEDGYKGKYGISCSIFTNYRIDKMKAGSN